MSTWQSSKMIKTMSDQVGGTAHPERNIGIGAILAFAIVGAVMITAVHGIARMVNDARWVEHTQQVINVINQIDGQITRREVALRNFQLTGSPAALARFQNLAQDVNETLRQLQRLTVDNPSEQDRVRQFDDVLRQREMQISSSADLAAALEQARRLPPVLSDPFPKRVDDVLSSMRLEEMRLLVIRRTAQINGVHFTYATLIALGILLMGLLVGTYAISRNALVARQLALEKRDHLNAELEKANAALELKSAEADHANKLKSQFLASMSHELRTPLNAISGFSELLAEQLAGPLTNKQKRFLTHIREASAHLLQLINDILDLSKIEAGEVRLELTPMTAAPVVEEVIAGLSAIAQNKAIAIHSQCPAAFVVQADRRRLKQMLYNLLSNALKFTPENGRIDVTVEQREGGCLFEVADTGPGIAEADQQIIFEEFRQAAAPANGVKEGTGLGLSITRKLVERHGGYMELESKSGEGSRFRFWLPGAISERHRAATEANQPQPVLASYSHRSSPLILVVDDDENACELIKNVLESAGYAVATSNSSAGALQAMRELKPDLITLDLLMPGCNGFGTLYELKAAHKDSLPPVVIVSVVDDKATGFALGAADYLLKPVSRDNLLNAVHKYLPSASASVLVVDDDPAVLEIAREVFSQPSLTLHLAATGREGLDILLTCPVDVIVLDLIMPGMDGFEFLTALRQHDRLSSIPVAVLTSKDLSKSELESLRSRVRSVFHKHDDWRPGLVLEVERILGRNLQKGASTS